MVKKTVILWILVFQFIGYGLGKITAANTSGTWYAILNKSALTPPNAVFSVTWGFLYVILALVGHLLWLKPRNDNTKIILALYALQMLVNWLWTPIFFQLHWFKVGFYCICIMLIITFTMILLCINHFKIISVFLFPYLIWLLFAAYLNGIIVLKN